MSYYTNTFRDHNNIEIIVNWSKSLWEDHLNRHQLIDFQNTNRLIETALKNPSVVMYCGGHSSTQKEKVYCYYYEVKRHQQLITYIKVVVGCNSKPPYVKSVWEQQALFHLVIKERKYNYFKEIWKNPNSYL